MKFSSKHKLSLFIALVFINCGGPPLVSPRVEFDKFLSADVIQLTDESKIKLLGVESRVPRENLYKDVIYLSIPDYPVILEIDSTLSSGDTTFAYVVLGKDSLLLNRFMIGMGHADISEDIDKNSKYYEKLLTARTYAKEYQNGFWKKDPQSIEGFKLPNLNWVSSKALVKERVQDFLHSEEKDMLLFYRNFGNFSISQRFEFIEAASGSFEEEKLTDIKIGIDIPDSSNLVSQYDYLAALLSEKYGSTKFNTKDPNDLESSFMASWDTFDSKILLMANSLGADLEIRLESKIKENTTKKWIEKMEEMRKRK